MKQPNEPCMSAWFAGPKAENAGWFSERLRQIVDDYYAWRRNYFPEDGVTVDSALRRHGESFTDAFEDKLIELLARLKADLPTHSPRYAAHMLAEQTLPGIAGYFAAMLYNPNNIAFEVATVTVKLELEAGRLLSKMIGYGPDAWAHLCSGGTSANIEALWAARAVKYLPFVVRDVRLAIGMPTHENVPDERLLAMSPAAALDGYAELWRQIRCSGHAADLSADANRAAAESRFNVSERGVAPVCSALGSTPVLLVPESHHYCFEKAMDVLGMGRSALRSVPVDENFRMRTDELGRAIDHVERTGGHVLAVVAVVGSTEEGSVDPIDRMVAMREAREAAGRSSFWLHADGAYGGYLRTVTIPVRTGLGEPRARVKVGPDVIDVPLTLPEHGECAALEKMGRCDSVTIDPHKLGYIPYPAGAICFRSDVIKPLMRQSAPYLGDAPGDPEQERKTESIGLYALEGSKPGASAAAVWLSHTLIPLDSSGHGRLIRDNIRNACELHALLESYPELARDSGDGAPPTVRAVCLCPPGSNIVCYAFRPERPGAGLAEINRMNRAVFDRFSPHAGKPVLEQSFFVSRTELSNKQYSLATVGGFLDRLGVSPHAYATEGVFLLRSVLMNPWYTYAKDKGRYYISELVAELYRAAAEHAESQIGSLEDTAAVGL